MYSAWPRSGSPARSIPVGRTLKFSGIMLFLMAYYGVASLICLWAGLLCYGIAGAKTNSGSSPVAIMLTGLMVLTAGGEWLALFVPLTPWSLVPVLLLLHLVAARHLNEVYVRFGDILRTLSWRGRPAWYIIALAGMLLLVLLFNAGPVRMDDTESYHIQAVKWMQTYGTVPGIANLHLRFGFNSAWFSAIALFTRSSAGFNGYLSLNGLTCFWFCFYLLNRFAAACRPKPVYEPPGRAIGILLVWLFCLGNWYMLRRSAASTTYDFIATICVLILLTEANDDEQLPMEWLIWPLFLFTTRITLFPLLLLPLAFCIMKSAEIKKIRWPGAVVCAALFIVPFIARNIVLSGFPFFPLTVFDFWNPDWKADARLAGAITEYIRYFNRVNPMFESIAETRARGNWGWIGAWWKYLFTIDKLTLLAGGAGYLMFVFRTRPRKPKMRLVITVIFISVILWFFTIPDPRFIQGILLAGLVFGAEALIRKPFPLLPVVVVSFTLAGIICAGYSAIRQSQDGTQACLILPHPLPVPPVREVRAGNMLLRIPEKILGNWNPRCYDVDLPCLYLPDPRLRPRGAQLADGFRLDSAGAANNEPFSGEYLTK